MIGVVCTNTSNNQKRQYEIVYIEKPTSMMTHPLLLWMKNKFMACNARIFQYIYYISDCHKINAYILKYYVYYERGAIKQKMIKPREFFVGSINMNSLKNVIPQRMLTKKTHNFNRVASMFKTIWNRIAEYYYSLIAYYYWYK